MSFSTIGSDEETIDEWLDELEEELVGLCLLSQEEKGCPTVRMKQNEWTNHTSIELLSFNTHIMHTSERRIYFTSIHNSTRIQCSKSQHLFSVNRASSWSSRISRWSVIRYENLCWSQICFARQAVPSTAFKIIVRTAKYQTESFTSM